MTAETIFCVKDLENQMAEDKEYLEEKFGENEVKRVYKSIKKLKNITPRGYQAKYIYVMSEGNNTLKAYAR